MLIFIILFYYHSDYANLEENKKTSELVKMVELNINTILEGGQRIFERIPESLRLAKNLCSEERLTKEIFSSLQNVN